MLNSMELDMAQKFHENDGKIYFIIEVCASLLIIMFCL